MAKDEPSASVRPITGGPAVNEVEEEADMGGDEVIADEEVEDHTRVSEDHVDPQRLEAELE